MKSHCIAVALGLILASGFAHAQSDAEREEARRRFDHAVRLMQGGAWQEAIPELDAVRAIMTTLPVLYNLGLAHRAVGHVLAARGAFDEFLQRGGDAVSAERRTEVQGFLDALNASVAHVALHVDPRAAAVMIDGSERTGDLARIEIDPGRHVVTARMEGHQPETREFEAPRGASVSVTLTLTRIRATGHLRVESAPREATILVDRLPVGAGVAEVELPAGPHTVDVQARGFHPFHRAIVLAAGSLVPLHARLEPQRITERAWFWVAVGVGAVALIATGIAVFWPTPGEPVTPSLGVATTSIRFKR